MNPLFVLFAHYPYISEKTIPTQIKVRMSGPEIVCIVNTEKT